MIPKGDELEVRMALKSEPDFDTREMVRRFYGIDRNQQTVEQIATHWNWRPDQVEWKINRFHKKHSIVPVPA